MDLRFRYYVIKFEIHPDSFLPYIVVHESRISRSLSKGDRIAVYFRDDKCAGEERLLTAGQPTNKYWNTYFGTKIIGNVNLEDAVEFARIKNKELEEDKIKRDQRHKERQARYEEEKKRKQKRQEKEKLCEPSTSATHVKSKHHKRKDFKKKDERKTKFLNHISKFLKFQNEQFNNLQNALNDLGPIIRDISNNMMQAITDVRERLDDIDTEEYNNVTTKRVKAKHRPTYTYPDNKDKSKKWTLKLPEFQKGSDRVELLPHSGIYVQKNKLERIKESCENSSELARSLLYEVFSDVAIQKCEEGDLLLEDSLDYYALVVLQMFVKEFCLQNNLPIRE